MTDIATLGYKVDSSGLEAGTRALDNNAAAADKVGKATANMERDFQSLSKTASESGDRLAGVAARGMQWAESTRAGNLSERALAEATREAAAGIDMKNAVMERAGSVTERMAERVRAMQAAEAAAEKTTQQAARATELQELNLKKLLGQIDPTVAALDRLAAMEAKLEKARDMGALKPEVFEQYQSKIDGMRASTLAAVKPTKDLGAGIGKLNFEAVQTQQSVASLARAVATGQWGMAQSSITSLTARTGLLGVAGLGATAVVGGLALGIGAAGGMAAKGYFEFRKLEGVIVGLGSASGITAGQALNLRNEIGAATGNYKDATAAVNQLLLSGKATRNMLDEMATSAVNMSRLTGQSIGSTVSEVQALADGGADALVKLNDRYNFLTLASWRQIEAIRAEKGEAAALRTTLVELDRAMQDRVDNMVNTAGRLERAWNAVTGSLGGALQALKDWGREDLEHRLSQSMSRMQNMKMGAGLSDPETYGPYVQARRDVERLLAEKVQLDLARIRDGGGAASSIKAEAEALGERNRAAKESNDLIGSRLAGIDKEVAKQRALNQLIEAFNNLPESDSRHFDGSFERLRAAEFKKIEEQFNRRDGAGKADPLASVIKRLRTQIDLNNEQIESEEKLTATQRMLIQVRNEVERIGGKGSATNRKLTESLMEQAKASGEAAAAEERRKRDLAANTALTEHLTQAERVRREQAEIDLIGMGRGGDVADRMRRELDIQRNHLAEVEKLDKAQRNKNTALSEEEYRIEVMLLEQSRNRMLQIETQFQADRLAIQGDWRNGMQRALDDYLAYSENTADQFGGLFATTFGGMEDAMVRAAQTGKLSFSSLADSIIADLARIAARRAVAGLLSAFMPGDQPAAQSSGSTFAYDGSAGYMSGYGSGWGSPPGRAYGGDVRGDRLYQVGERDNPELLQSGGKQYMIPGDRGRVVPLKGAQGGGGGAVAAAPQINVSVVIDNNGSANSSTESTGSEGRKIGELIGGRVREVLVQEQRQGGILWNMQQGRA